MRQRLATGSIILLTMLVVGLSVASLSTLWTTGAKVVRRERSRAEASRGLTTAAVNLADSARPVWGFIPAWPETLSHEEWDVVDDFLREQAAEGLSRFPDVEGGYFLPSHDLFLGRAIGRDCPRIDPESSSPPEPARDSIVDQLRQSLSEDQPLVSVTGSTAAPLVVRTATIRDDSGQIIGAIWTMTRLNEPLFLDRAAASAYRSAASMAMGGIGLALALALLLAFIASRTARERARLQGELRRSERLAALGKLLAGVAHEVRNPLAGIRSSAQLWNRGIGPDRESIETVIAEVDRLDTIVSQLLRFSRSHEPKLVAGNLNDLVAEAADLIRPTADAQGVQVDVQLAEAPPEVAMDSSAILQILRNLTRNALEAMPEGGQLRLQTRTSPGRRGVEIEVEDTGRGLTQEARRHLFEPFFTTKSDGTGLGLAIAREIAMAHRGLLTADDPMGSSSTMSSTGSEPGRGARFRLWMPAARRAFPDVLARDPLSPGSEK